MPVNFFWRMEIGRPQKFRIYHGHGFLHWIGLRENLQETMVFTIKYCGNAFSTESLTLFHMTKASKRQQGWSLSIHDSAFRAGCPVTCILFLPVCRCRLEKSARKRGKAKASNLNANRWTKLHKKPTSWDGQGGAPLRARHCTSKMKLIPKWLLQNNPDKQLILSFIPKSSRLPGVWVLGTTMSTIKIPLWKCVFHWISDVVSHD